MNRVIVSASLGKHKINRHIYGHFSEHLGRCIYGGYWVGEDSPIPNTRGIRNDVAKALRGIKTPNMRWPGGCFADEYHWMDGIGPRSKRPTMINTHWGGVTENNHFGTHEFLDLCDQLACEPYICGNVGSGTVQEMSQWVEYVNFGGVSPMANLRAANGRKEPWKVKYWGVGNENWGCGGHMRPEYYADQYRRYATYCRNYGESKLYKIACGPNGGNYQWTEVLMRDVPHWMMQGLALHYYTSAWIDGKRGIAIDVNEKNWMLTMLKGYHTEELVAKHSTIMDRYDPQKKVALIVDEWGCWWDVEPGTNPGFLYQQNTMRDALVAGLSLNVFNNHCERVQMANIAQTVNVLQSMVLTEGEKMLVTPTYHVFALYKVHQDATMLPVQVECKQYEVEKQQLPQVSASASRDDSGAINVSLCNLHFADEAEVTLSLPGASIKTVSGKVLAGKEMSSHNTFDKPKTVKPAEFKDAQIKKRDVVVRMPARSVVVLKLT